MRPTSEEVTRRVQAGESLIVIARDLGLKLAETAALLEVPAEVLQRSAEEFGVGRRPPGEKAGAANVGQDMAAAKQSVTETARDGRSGKSRLRSSSYQQGGRRGL